MMDSLGFKNWLDEAKADKSIKHRKDLVCRANRVEREFKSYNKRFSLDREYKKDGGESLVKKLRFKGKALENKPLNLPIGSNQMSDFATAVKAYFKYMSEKEDK